MCANIHVESQYMQKTIDYIWKVASCHSNQEEGENREINTSWAVFISSSKSNKCYAEFCLLAAICKDWIH